MELKPINNEANLCSKNLLTFGRFTIALWIVLSAVACWFFNQFLGFLFLISALILIFAILRRHGSSSCYYYKTYTMGFGKLADLFFGSNSLAGVNSSRSLKIIFVYGILGAVPIGFLVVSFMQELAVTKIAELAFLLFFLLYIGSR